MPDAATIRRREEHEEDEGRRRDDEEEGRSDVSTDWRSEMIRAATKQVDGAILAGPEAMTALAQEQVVVCEHMRQFILMLIEREEPRGGP